MKSILQQDESKCYLCGCYEGNDHLDIHHVFEGIRRQKSEEYGLVVKLHHRTCHQEGPHSVHRNSEVMREMKQKAQREAMEYYGWDEDEWRERFYKSYL